mmetsp:Transcript_19006/g.44336  ORF Transcript_19006/g.44336 Transcript_19006/m.44336 type:complete len:374 (-) Transcript_19006:13-1134(-)
MCAAVFHSAAWSAIQHGLAFPAGLPQEPSRRVESMTQPLQQRQGQAQHQGGTASAHQIESCQSPLAASSNKLMQKRIHDLEAANANLIADRDAKLQELHLEHLQLQSWRKQLEIEAHSLQLARESLKNSETTAREMQDPQGPLLSQADIPAAVRAKDAEQSVQAQMTAEEELSTGEDALAVVVDVKAVWLPLQQQLPPAAHGCAPFTLHVGLLFGSESEGDGPVQICSASLCPEHFVWQPDAPIEDEDGSDPLALIDAMSDHLDSALKDFLAKSFLLWASAESAAQDVQVAAWFLCTDGEAFALPKSAIEFGCAGSAAVGTNVQAPHCWRRTAVVIDRSKSRPEEPALEALRFRGSREEPSRGEAIRLLYDLC